MQAISIPVQYNSFEYAAARGKDATGRVVFKINSDNMPATLADHYTEIACQHRNPVYVPAGNAGGFSVFSRNCGSCGAYLSEEY